MSKFPYTAECHYAADDQIEVDFLPEDVDIRLGLTGRSVYLTPKKARRLAKAIKKAAKRAEAEQ